MSIQDTNILKQKFETGAMPTQEDFQNLLDSFFHKSLAIPQSSIGGLVDALAGKMNTAQAQQLIDMMSGGAQAITPSTVVPTPSSDKRYTAIEAGTYSNLKKADGSAASVITVSADDLNAVVYIDYNKATNSWAKKVQPPAILNGNTLPVASQGGNGNYYWYTGENVLSLFKKENNVWNFVKNFKAAENLYIPHNEDLTNVTFGHFYGYVQMRQLNEMLSVGTYGDGSKIGVNLQGFNIIMSTPKWPYLPITIGGLVPSKKYDVSFTLTYNGSGEMSFHNDSLFIPPSGTLLKKVYTAGSDGKINTFLMTCDGYDVGSISNIVFNNISIVEYKETTQLNGIRVIEAGTLSKAPIGLLPGVSVQSPAQPNSFNYDGTNLWLTNSAGVTKKITLS